MNLKKHVYILATYGLNVFPWSKSKSALDCVWIIRHPIVALGAGGEYAVPRCGAVAGARCVRCRLRGDRTHTCVRLLIPSSWNQTTRAAHTCTERAGLLATRSRLLALPPLQPARRADSLARTSFCNTTRLYSSCVRVCVRFTRPVRRRLHSLSSLKYI